ncbi:MAG TPA: FHA domain-containing protein [Streptosporangiaceae bacterium]|nr:FHA domain-containing protein [Streptosporangiaceae bacterium]
MEAPHLQIAVTGAVVPLQPEVTTVGRGSFTDITLTDPSVSVLHAEIVRRGPYVYVSDLGLSRNGTRVNGRLVAKRLLTDGDALTFGSARCRIGGIVAGEVFEEQPPKSVTPELTRRELDVIASLCRPAMSDDAFVTPATAREIAADLVVTEAAVKQHLLRLYSKLRIVEGVNRRIRLANEVIALGLAKPQVPDDQRGLPAPRAVPPGRAPEPAQRWRPGQGQGPGPGSVPPYPPPAAAAADRRRVTGRTGGPG